VRDPCFGLLKAVSTNAPPGQQCRLPALLREGGTGLTAGCSAHGCSHAPVGINGDCFVLAGVPGYAGLNIALAIINTWRKEAYFCPGKVFCVSTLKYFDPDLQLDK